MNVDAILFDLDGTLIDSRVDIANAVRHMQTQYAAPLSTNEDVAAFIGDGIGSLVDRALPGLSREAHARAVDVLKAYYREHCLDHTTMYAGVADVLLRVQTKKMAIVTNKPERVSRRILQGLGLTGYFPVVIGGDTLPEKKPHPAPLQKALRDLGGVPPARAVMVGDSANDVNAGRAAGLRTVGIYSNIGDHAALDASGPDFTISDFRALADLQL